MTISLKCLARPVVVCLCVLTAIPAITGTVYDAAGAVIPAPDRGENQCNGIVYRKQQGSKTENIAEIRRVRKAEEIHIIVVGSSPGLSMIWDAPGGQETKAMRGATLTKAGR